ncbi:MAG: transposase [Deltaproteobacteria bacterium]|nr:transposase [Deltaproteobacteria bacterium]
MAMRFTARQGELFSDGEGVRYLAVVSNRRELSAKALARWHWGKAGTIEHTHRVMKDELGAGVLPCQQFGANAAWFRCNVITYNLLTLLRRRALPERYWNARPKRLRFEIFAIPGRLARPQGQLTVTVSAGDERYMELAKARERLWLMRHALADEKTRRPLPARNRP